MFSTIPQNRLILYLLIIGLIPVTLAWFSFSSQLEEARALDTQMWRLQDMALSREKKQSANIAMRNHFREVDHFFIDKNLETLALLEPEIESLKGMQNNPNFPEDDNIKKRIEFLTGSANSMIFTEGVVQSTPIFQEVTETLVHPVEVNVHDLQQILCRVEGVAIGDCPPPATRPQLIILDFKLDKKHASEKNQVFSLNLKLLKREFL